MHILCDYYAYIIYDRLWISEGRSLQVPDSVHKLRPGDIDVIGSMGDSLTAGAGAFATNLFQVAVENRGVSAAGGGQGTWREYLTLPNILKVLMFGGKISLVIIA